jgi:hypothetical protein
MATYQDFLGSAGGLRIEAEDVTGSATASAYDTEFLAALQAIATRTLQQVNQIPREQRPTELAVSFGLKALSSGGFAIGLGDADANFRVSMTWSQNGGEPLAGVPELPGPDLGLP